MRNRGRQRWNVAIETREVLQRPDAMFMLIHTLFMFMLKFHGPIINPRVFQVEVKYTGVGARHA